MNVWSELVRASLLGTARHTPDLNTPDSLLDAQLNAFVDQDAPERLLNQAATVALYRLAGGQLTPHTFPPQAACAPDNRPVPAAGTTALLESLLEESDPRLAQFWLQRATAMGYRPPDSLLPPLLSKGVNNPKWEHHVIDAIDVRGRWLAAKQDAWQYAQHDYQDVTAMTKAWRYSKNKQRLLLFARLRRLDPNQARKMMLSTWARDETRFKSELLQRMRPELSPSDEPFLERALDEKSFLLRREAAKLLAELPNSAYAGRMTAYATNMVSWMPAADGALPTLSVQLWDSPDAAMLRDAVPRYRAQKVSGEPRQSAQLVHVLSATPLDVWTERWVQTPVEIVIAASRSQLQRSLLRGFVQAARRQRDVAWMEALLDVTGEMAVGRFGTAELIAHLPVAEREAFATNVIKQARRATQPLQRVHVVIVVLRQCQHDWSERFGRTVLDWLIHRIRLDAVRKRRDNATVRTVRDLAYLLPLTQRQLAIDKLTRATRNNRERWQESIDALTRIMAQRQAIEDQLQPPVVGEEPAG